MSNQFQLETERLLSWMAKEHPGESEALPFWVRGTARKNDKRAAKLELVVPDHWVLNIKGDPMLQDAYVAIRIPMEHVQEFKGKDKLSENQKALFDAVPETEGKDALGST